MRLCNCILRTIKKCKVFIFSWVQILYQQSHIFYCYIRGATSVQGTNRECTTTYYSIHTRLIMQYFSASVTFAAFSHENSPGIKPTNTHGYSYRVNSTEKGLEVVPVVERDQIFQKTVDRCSCHKSRCALLSGFFVLKNVFDSLFPLLL